MSTCMQVGQLLARPNGPKTILQAVNLAIRGCRRSIECECVQIIEGDVAWWDTDGGLFTGACDNDLEFMAMRREDIAFLDEMQAIRRHPEHAHWISFIEPTT
jgi:hypothetical protein